MTSASYGNNFNLNASEDEESNETHTSSNRSASGRAFTNPLMFPFFIHSDTITNRSSVTVVPNNDSTFG